MKNIKQNAAKKIILAIIVGVTFFIFTYLMIGKIFQAPKGINPKNPNERPRPLTEEELKEAARPAEQGTFKPLTQKEIDESIRQLTDEELKNVQPLTGEKIEEASKSAI